MTAQRPAGGARIDATPDGAVPRRGPTAWASPPAVRRSASRWRDPRLAVGCAVVAACALLGARLLAAADDSVSVWVAGTALSPGQPVTTADLVRRSVRFDGQADADRYLSADAALPAGAVVDRAVGPGELLARSALQDRSTSALTQLPLSVGTEAVPDSVLVGSTVDVWVTPQGPAPGSGAAPGAVAAPGARSSRVLRNVRVVSAPAPATSLGPTATRQVVVGVAADQARLLPTAIAALASGDVLLTSRR